jgi:predicted Fe-Mo cluster-binding NifX family protein
MIKHIAIPIENGVLCAHFGHCQSFAIVSMENDNITEIREIAAPEHVPGLYPRWIAGFGVTNVIAGGIGAQAIQLFNQQNVNVFAGAPVKTARELVTDFNAGKLTLSANYCNHDDHEGHTSCHH